MKIFEGKSPAERNKIIAALVLGALALFAIGYNIIGFFPSRKTTVTVSTSPTPTATSTPSRTGDTVVSSLPTNDEINFLYETTEVVYHGSSSAGAPDAGRNIFAFYEPPPPTPWVDLSTPVPIVTPPPPSPTPPPPQTLYSLNRQSVYSGEKSFQLEVSGDKFTPDTRIIFNGSEIPTTYVSPQRLVANVSTNMITGEGARTVMTRSTDGALYSNQMLLNVQTPPQPQFQYIGMIARKRGNNDTAYFTEPGKNNAPPFGARLNDILAGRFRLISISAERVIFEDVSLGFKHPLNLQRPDPSKAATTSGRGNEYNPYNNTYNPTMPNYTQPPLQTQDIPGIPSNIPRYRPTPNPTQQQQKQDKDDDEDGDN